MYWFSVLRPASPSFFKASSCGETVVKSWMMIDAEMYGMMFSAKIAMPESHPPKMAPTRLFSSIVPPTQEKATHMQTPHMMPAKERVPMAFQSTWRSAFSWTARPSASLLVGSSSTGGS